MGTEWTQALGKDCRGSRPRCILLVDGTRESVAEALTDLIGIKDAVVTSDDCWMPRGKPIKQLTGWDVAPTVEARLDRDPGFINRLSQQTLTDWWLAVSPRANTPNWDIASTCLVGGEPGLLLVEAKAHANELSASGKSKPTTRNGRKNHGRIATAICEANAAFEGVTGMPWSLSRDHCYQLSNRFAWAWKLVSLGIPVILIYLGFLAAEEMADDGPLFYTHDDWINSLKHHSAGTVNDSCWENPLYFDRVPLLPLIRTLEQPFGTD